jgi:hypothetical protein
VDFNGGPPDEYDDLDYDDGNSDGDVFKALIKELKNLDTITGPNLAEALPNLLVPQPGTVPGISVAEALADCFVVTFFKFVFHILNSNFSKH